MESQTENSWCFMNLDDFISKSYFSTVADAENKRFAEHAACLRIQAAFRGYIQRKNLSSLHAAAVEIQRIYRGMKGRSIYRNELKKKQHEMQLQYFAKQATLIQKLFRGYLSRKHLCSFYQRKQYIEAVTEQGELIHDGVKEYREKLDQYLAEEEKERQKEEYRKEALKLHHLVGTKAIQGVFSEEKPENDVLGTTADRHFKAAMKSEVPNLLAQKRLSDVRKMKNAKAKALTASLPRPGPATAPLTQGQLRGTIGTANQSIFSRTTPQGPFLPAESLRPQPLPSNIMARDSPYGGVEEKRRLDRKFDKMRRVGSRDFVVPKHIHHGPPASLRIDEPYADPRISYRSDKPDKFVTEKPFSTFGAPMPSIYNA